MKHASAIDRVAHWVGVTWTTSMADQVQRYARWLVSEAIPAGALGPREVERLEDRHLADAMVLVRPWRTMPQPSVVDLGSGAGLPGIVTAILRPDARVCLVERAGRRLDLLGRALRVLGLSNVTVCDGDLHDVDARYDVALMRAVLPDARGRPRPSPSAGTDGPWRAGREPPASAAVGATGRHRGGDRSRRHP